MAYGFKAKYKRKFARKGRVAKLARGKATSIKTLAKAVSRIQRKMRSNCEYLNYRVVDSPTISADYTVVPLSNYSAWADIFGTASNDDTANRMIHKSFGMDCYLTLENTVNEPDSTQFTIFLVTLKDNIGSAYAPASSSLSLLANVHYSISGGMVLLNKKCFTIHKIIRKVLTNHGTSLANPSAQTQSGTDYRFYVKHRANHLVTNPTGDWKSMGGSPDPSKAMYMLIFNDNSSLDLQNPKFTYNVVHTVQTVA